MRYKVNFSDLVYEANYRAPFFLLAGNAVRVLEAIHSSLSPKYPIASGDMAVEAGRAVGEVRARVTFFAGNGTLEISADSFTARFNNPKGNEDMQIIQDCIALTHEALHKLGDTRSIREESVTIRIFCEPSDGSEASKFLRGLFQQSKLAERGNFPPNANMVPGFAVDLFQDEEKWAFSFTVSQALRSQKEMFLTSSIRFFYGNRFSSLHEKAAHFGTLIEAAMSKVGLQPDEKQK